MMVTLAKPDKGLETDVYRTNRDRIEVTLSVRLFDFDETLAHMLGMSSGSDVMQLVSIGRCILDPNDIKTADDDDTS